MYEGNNRAEASVWAFVNDLQCTEERATDNPVKGSRDSLVCPNCSQVLGQIFKETSDKFHTPRNVLLKYTRIAKGGTELLVAQPAAGFSSLSAALDHQATFSFTGTCGPPKREFERAWAWDADCGITDGNEYRQFASMRKDLRNAVAQSAQKCEQMFAFFNNLRSSARWATAEINVKRAITADFLEQLKRYLEKDKRARGCAEAFESVLRDDALMSVRAYRQAMWCEKHMGRGDSVEPWFQTACRLQADEREMFALFRDYVAITRPDAGPCLARLVNNPAVVLYAIERDSLSDEQLTSLPDAIFSNLFWENALTKFRDRRDVLGTLLRRRQLPQDPTVQVLAFAAAAWHKLGDDDKAASLLALAEAALNLRIQQRGVQPGEENIAELVRFHAREQECLVDTGHVLDALFDVHNIRSRVDLLTRDLFDRCESLVLRAAFRDWLEPRSLNNECATVTVKPPDHLQCRANFIVPFLLPTLVQRLRDSTHFRHLEIVPGGGSRTKPGQFALHARVEQVLAEAAVPVFCRASGSLEVCRDSLPPHVSWIHACWRSIFEPVEAGPLIFANCTSHRQAPARLPPDDPSGRHDSTLRGGGRATTEQNNRGGASRRWRNRGDERGRGSGRGTRGRGGGRGTRGRDFGDYDDEEHGDGDKKSARSNWRR